MAIKCCNGCVPPKRNEYCHAVCPEYKAEKEKHEAERAAINRKKAIEGGLTAQELKRSERVEKTQKHAKWR